jgi:3-oxoacyl-[acyl-carrier protein] reductase
MNAATGPLAGKTALVTGGSRGIGRAVSERLAADGASVAVNFNGDGKAADDVVTAIGERGGRAVAVRADVSTLDGITSLFDTAEERLGPLDIVVANAATFVLKPVTELTEEEFGSKGAVEQFVRGLAQEVGVRGITVNAVLPGFTDTGMLPERDRATAEERSPFRRIGQPADVGDAIALLAGPGARWVTGQLLGAGGGVF